MRMKKFLTLLLIFAIILSFTGCTGKSQEPSPSPKLNVKYVWIPKTGTKYHSISTCSSMKNPSKVTLESAIDQGYTECNKCW